MKRKLFILLILFLMLGSVSCDMTTVVNKISNASKSISLGVELAETKAIDVESYPPALTSATSWTVQVSCTDNGIGYSSIGTSVTDLKNQKIDVTLSPGKWTATVKGYSEEWRNLLLEQLN